MITFSQNDAPANRRHPLESFVHEIEIFTDSFKLQLDLLRKQKQHVFFFNFAFNLIDCIDLLGLLIVSYHCVLILGEWRTKIETNSISFKRTLPTGKGKMNQ